MEILKPRVEKKEKRVVYRILRVKNLIKRVELTSKRVKIAAVGVLSPTAFD